MPSVSSSEVKFEIGHVLFIDIVGYSKLSINEQSEQIQTLRKIVRGAEQVRLAETQNKLIRLPTGDGGALVFRNSPEAPVLCALEIGKELKNHPELHVRMGIHSGPVNEVVDLNEQANIAGAGINIAQRVMDCGDAGHILVSKRVGDDLQHYQHWRSLLHELGECEVKHGLRISLLNLYGDEAGNPEPPEKFRLAKASAAVRDDEEFWLAVIPFKTSGDAEMESFANGLGEDITTGLSRFRYLSVVARDSTARLKGEAGDERTLGAKLGARYVLEGSIRKGGPGVRVSAQLVDTETRAQLWAETYNRDLETSTIFAAQDDIAAHIVATVADSYGVLVRSMRDAIRQRDDAELTPAQWQFQFFAYREQITPSAHAALKSRLQRAMERDEAQSDLCACLAEIYVDEYAFGFQDDATSLDRALAAARRAVEIDRSNQFAMVALAQTHFFRQDLAAFRPAAERAMALNPLNTDALGILGLQIVHTGEFERGTAIVRRAMELNANHAGWMHFAPLWNHFHKGEYEEALECANRVDFPGFFWPYLVMASACGHLGRSTEAKAAVADLLALDPEFAAHARSKVGTWHFASGLMEPILEGLRKAGLSIPGNDGSLDSPKRIEPVTSKTNRAEKNDQKSIAVLPFVNMSADDADEYLSDGMTEELINALAKVPGLRVPGRTSCFFFKGKTEADIFRSVGDQLHVDKVLEGSVRKAGDKLRVTAQLINVSDGYHLWSEDYDGNVQDIFTFQSNVAQRVVEALQVKLGVEEKRALTKKPTQSPEAHRLYLLGRYEFGKYSEAGWTSSIRYYEQALKLDPNYALAYCGLADTFAYMGGVLMPSKEAVAKEKEFAQKALELDPELPEAHLSLACALAGAFDWRNAQVEFDRAIELNPNLAWAYEIYAWFLGGLGRSDEAIAKDKKAIELDPLNSFFQSALAYFLYHARRYDDAIVQIKKTLELDPASTLARHLLGCCLLWKGDTAGAIAEFQRSKIVVTGAWYQGLLGYAYAISGDRSKAEQMLGELEEMAKRQYVSTTAFAMIYLGLGEKEKALDWLDKSYEDQESACWYLKVDPIYDSVRNEPRFQALVQKVVGPKP